MAHPGGRPVKYNTVEDLQKIVDEYFAWCDNRAIKKVDDDGKEYMVSSPAPYTMSGLARRLGLSRQGLIEYSQKDEFSDAIKEAREKVHEDVETRLMEKAATGPIFNLKNNFGWKDEQHTDITSKGEQITPNVTIDTHDLTGKSTPEPDIHPTG